MKCKQLSWRNAINELNMNIQTVEARERVISENFEAFESILPSILIKHSGKIALLHDRKITGFYDSSKDAILQGRALFPKHDFSVQKVEPQTVDLGWYSHA